MCRVDLAAGLHGKGGEGTYKQFKDAIGESWTESNAKFLDDSMWLGWANNRNEMKGDIWHPQAPTKTFSERGGLLGLVDGPTMGLIQEEGLPEQTNLILIFMEACRGRFMERIRDWSDSE